MDKIQSKNNNMNRLISDIAIDRVTKDSKGIKYLTETIDACPSAPHSGIIEIYKCVAEKHGVTHKTVMREISYALSRYQTEK